jgi:putative hydrolase of the HAD superfamily
VPISSLFIDLDDTLYPQSSGLWPALRERISRYMVERLGIPADQAGELRRQYFEQYGTALRGLEMHYPMDREDYLDYVHAVDLRDYIGPDPTLRAALEGVSARKFIFTNADNAHARRVTDILGVSDCFDGVIDTNALAPYCKPERAAFERALAIAEESDPARCALIDDLPRTVRAAREFGIVGILFGAAAPDGGADVVLDDWSKLGEVMREIA